MTDGLSFGRFLFYSFIQGSQKETIILQLKQSTCQDASRRHQLLLYINQMTAYSKLSYQSTQSNQTEQLHQKHEHIFASIVKLPAFPDRHEQCTKVLLWIKL